MNKTKSIHHYFIHPHLIIIIFVLYQRTKRTGWVNHGVKPAESIADHMYRMSVMALLIDENTAGVDKNRCIKMAIVHDLAESLVVSWYPQCVPPAQ